MKINWDILEKAGKEFFRVIVLAIIPVLIISIENGIVDWKFIGLVAIVAGLKFIDKLLHEVGKTEGNEKLLTGLTRF